MSDSVRPHRRQPTRPHRPWDSPGKNTGVGCHFLLQCMKAKVKLKSLSCVRLLATPWTAAYQAPPSMGFSRQEYWSGVPLPSPALTLCKSMERIMNRECIHSFFHLLNTYYWMPVHGVTMSQTRLSDFTFTFHLHALEKEMATHSSVLAWRIPGTGEPGGLLSLGSHRVGHD